MKVIVLCGLPGSGKSTFAKKYKNYVVINQDKIGNRYKCLELFRKSLEEGKSSIIDRCNISKSQRVLWINVAKEFGVKEINAINLVINPEEALQRIINRKGHPTISEDTTEEKIKSIIDNFVKTQETPTLEEGFAKVLHIKVNVNE